MDGEPGDMFGPQPRQSFWDAPLPWDRGKYGLADGLAVAPLYSDTPPPWDRGKHLVWSTHPLGGWGTNLDIGRTSVTGSGRWEWLPPNLVAPRVVKPLRLVGVYIFGE